jgi:hypothetical protein
VKLTLTRIPFFVLKAQQYLPIALMILAIARVFVLKSLDGEGGTGL